ncbi:DNA polymerase II [bacterium BMS3Abin03]|nr:DNA polymerase II [bacterium BMS3Abin03]
MPDLKVGAIKLTHKRLRSGLGNWKFTGRSTETMMNHTEQHTAHIFILTGEWFDSRGSNVLRFIGTSEEFGPVEVKITNNKPVFFVRRESDVTNINIPYTRKEVKLKTFDGKDVDALYFNTQSDLRRMADELNQVGIRTYESDVDPTRRFLMERFINAQIKVAGSAVKNGSITTFVNPKIEPCEVTPEFVVASIDIETGVNNTRLYSIAVHVTGKKGELKKVFIVSEEDKSFPEFASSHSEEKELLIAFIKWFKEIDPDIIVGWHVIGFDLMFLESKCNEYHIPFEIARANGRVSLRTRKPRGYFASITGRVVIDGPPALRSSFFTFEDYRLETVAQEFLAEGKTITADKNKVEEIERQFKEDKKSLIEYNLKDAVLVTDIFQKSALIELSVRRAQLSGLLMDQLGMMTAAFDHFYLPKLHRAGYVASNVKDIETNEHAAGGYVMEPVPGIYNDVVVLDFKSLYPTIIRTFKIDPLSRLLSHIDTIETLNGYRFSATQHFLPDFIEQLMEQRSIAKKRKDKQLSQAIKILMNSFYGVMGSFGCRFYHPHLPTAITGTGHKLLLGSKDYLAEKGYNVVYGDTDSLFIKLKEGEGENAAEHGHRLANELNKYWKEKIEKEYGLKSYLELEYEKHYRKFIITAARGSEAGAKKRYAGLLVDDGKEKVEFVGMEVVRSDWTYMAKEFQLQLYEKIFNNEDVDEWIKDFVNRVKNGEFDDKLVYRKRLRKDVADYTKNVPQHVKAARMLGETGGTVYYVITKRGPVPIELKHNDIDYQHYIEKQLKPIADSVLGLLGKSFDAIVESDQLSFF